LKNIYKFLFYTEMCINWNAESIADSEESLTSQLPQLESYVTNEIVSQCVVNLKAVTDIPRLYRRTNRDVSSHPSLYICLLHERTVHCSSSSPSHDLSLNGRCCFHEWPHAECLLMENTSAETSSVARQAVRCWAVVNYSNHSHT